MAEFTIEDYTAPESAPHKYAPLVQQLIDAGEGKIAKSEFENEEAARLFLHSFQTAANKAGKSARKAVYEVNEKTGKVIMGVRVGEKINRQRKTEEAPAE